MSAHEKLPHPHTRPVVREMRHDPGERPFIVIWEVTRACALVCRHCRADAQKAGHPNQLTTEQGKKLLDELASFGTPRPLVVLTGGDPFEREDLTELTAYGTSIGLSVSLSPSVTPKLTRERVSALRAAGGKAMSVSLDGAVAATHDAFRGFVGTFDKTVAAAHMIVEEGFRLQVNTTVTKNNVRELPALLADVLGMGAHMWYVFFLVPTGRGAGLNALDSKEKEDVLHWLHDVSDRIAIKTTEAPQYRRVALQRDSAKAQGTTIQRGELHAWLTQETARLIGAAPEKPRPPRPPMAVNSGSGFAFVDHLGDVYPSGFLPFVCGNVKDQPFPEIYRTAEMLISLRTPGSFHGKCGVCDYNTVCGGSRSHAYAVTGDPLGSDPTCEYVPAGLLGEKSVQ
ncbi:MAG: TIGR04053 family radical SAM/SPASM domain-containing protein [Propionibacteriaceae bacterium]